MSGKNTLTIILASAATFVAGYLISLAFISSSINNSEMFLQSSEKKHITGRIEKLSGKEIILKINNKTERAFLITPNTSVFITGGKLSLSEGMTVIVYFKKNEDAEKTSVDLIKVSTSGDKEDRNNSNADRKGIE